MSEVTPQQPPPPAGTPGLTRRNLLTLAGRGAAAAIVGGLAVNGAVRAVRPAQAGPVPIDASGTPARALEKDLRIGYLPITDAAALLLAHDLGLFAGHGVPSTRPVLFRSWEALAQAFTVGEVDVVHLLMPFAVQLRYARNVPARVLGWGHANGSALTVRRGITRVEQLAGTTVAIPYWWSVHNILLQQVLAAAGLQVRLRSGGGPAPTATLNPSLNPAPDPSGHLSSTSASRGSRGARGAVDLVVMPPAEMASALAAGRISGFVVADPFSAVAEANGSGVVLRFLGDVWRSHGCCAIVVRQDLISDTPHAAQGITDAIVAAQQWADGHRGGIAERLTGAGAYLPQKPAAVHRVVTRGANDAGLLDRNPTWHGERLEFTALPYPSATSTLVSLMKQTRVDGDTTFLDRVDPTTVHAELVDDRFVRNSLTRAGAHASSWTRSEEVAP